MQLFIDSANISEIKEVSNLGLIKGVTTNPTLISKTNSSIDETIRNISSIVDGPISIEVTKDTYNEMLEQALNFYKINPRNIVIKVPMTYDGLKLCRELSNQGIKTNITLCFSVSQALLAMESKATYVSLFIGRLLDDNQDAFEILNSIVKIKHIYNFQTEIISASIRNVDQVEKCAQYASDIVTIPYQVLKDMITNPLTEKGIKKFKEDALKIVK